MRAGGERWLRATGLRSEPPETTYGRWCGMAQCLRRRPGLVLAAGMPVFATLVMGAFVAGLKAGTSIRRLRRWADSGLRKCPMPRGLIQVPRRTGESP